MDIREQWEADIAVHFARTETYTHRAIALAEAAIQAARPAWERALRRARKAEAMRWSYERRRRKRVGDIHAGE